MADLTIPNTCSSYDALSGQCRVLGGQCPFARTGDFKQCGQCTFLAKVVMPPDEFHVLLDRQLKPTVGQVPMKRCRVAETIYAAGAYVNDILSTHGEEPGLDLWEQLDGSARLHCRHSDVAVEYRNGQFVPA